MTLYPNPATSTSNLFINSRSTDALKVTIEVMDVTGKVVLTPALDQEVNFGYNNFQIDVQSLNTGIYFVTINNGVSKETVKLIVNH